MTLEEFFQLTRERRRERVQWMADLKRHPDGTPWQWDASTFEPVPWTLKDWDRGGLTRPV